MSSKTFKCLACDQICDLVEKDEGGYVEFWGARVWHPQFTDVSDCCLSEDYEEVDEDTTPYCSGCGAMDSNHCNCLPIAENE